MTQNNFNFKLSDFVLVLQVFLFFRSNYMQSQGSRTADLSLKSRISKKKLATQLQKKKKTAFSKSKSCAKQNYILLMRLHDIIYESKDATKYYATSFYTTIWYKAASAVYVALYNTTTLWHPIGFIWVVMGCYDRKPKFADAANTKKSEQWFVRYLTFFF